MTSTVPGPSATRRSDPVIRTGAPVISRTSVPSRAPSASGPVQSWISATTRVRPTKVRMNSGTSSVGIVRREVMVVPPSSNSSTTTSCSRAPVATHRCSWNAGSQSIPKTASGSAS